MLLWAMRIVGSPRRARNLKEVAIVWKLDAPAGFAFATDGVNFKNKELASRQFRVSKAAGPDEFRWEDANTAPGTFPYNVKVTHNGRDCPILDPTVVNDDVSPP